jgi:uncharacterized repeat protein (TIGR03803 family)
VYRGGRAIGKITSAAGFLAVVIVLVGGNTTHLVAAQDNSGAGSPSKEQVLYSFTDLQTAGHRPSGLVSDSAGNLYGVTYRGGSFGGGTVFELTLQSDGWRVKTLYNFHSTHGTRPVGNLIFDKSGNLYGVTLLGGAFDCLNGIGCGTVYELSPQPDGNWKETVLHKFSGYPNDGWMPESGLIFDASGNLYGTTYYGGKYDRGTIFELSSQGSEMILHSFKNEPDPKGTFIGSALLMDSAGNLYGTADGGTLGGGLVFKLSLQRDGRWTETVLHTFSTNSSNDGSSPSSALIMDAAGNLYGTTLFGVSVGGKQGYGTVYEVSPQQGGGWTEKVIHSFSGSQKDGEYPQANLILDGSGNLCSTTQGSSSTYKCDRSGFSCGTVFQLSPQSGGVWTETELHNFSGSHEEDGEHPAGYIVLNPGGNIFGTTFEGGEYAKGAVFEVTP